MIVTQLTVGHTAPDFSLPDKDGSLVRLSEVYSQNNVLLVFNIGFA
jgi:peroxiredoxin